MRNWKTWLMVLVMFSTAAVVSTLDVVVPRAAACSCAQYTFEEAVEEVDLIAEVTMVEDLGAIGTNNHYLFSMQRIWKGEASQFVVVTEFNEETSCGGPRIPEIGEQKRLWGYVADEQGHYRENFCLFIDVPHGDERTRLLNEHFGEAVPVTDADPVGPSPSPEPTEPSDDGTTSSGDDTPWWQSIPLVIAAFAALAATAGGVALAFGRKPHTSN